MYEKELEAASEVALRAGESIMNYFRGDFEIESKPLGANSSEPVTVADKTSSRVIVEFLAEEFPEDAILSEEEEDDTERRLRSERVWIIDPLDGTRGFTEGKGDFAVQIGLVEQGRPVVGLVYQPVTGRLYRAAASEGAFLSVGELESERLNASDIKEFHKMTIAVSRSHRSLNMDRILDHFGFENEYRHGSVGLKIGFVARREADIYIHLSPHTKFWDTAAPQVIIEEAGGQLTDIFGSAIDYTLADVRNHNGIFASNGAVHDAAVSHLRPLLTDFGRLRVATRN